MRRTSTAASLLAAAAAAAHPPDVSPHHIALELAPTNLATTAHAYLLSKAPILAATENNREKTVFNLTVTQHCTTPQVIIPPTPPPPRHRLQTQRRA